MARVKKAGRAVDQVSPQAHLQELHDPEVTAYINSLKKRYRKYAMPLDEARATIDRSMGNTTLTQLLREARE